MRYGILAILSLVLSPMAAQAASFDCAKASSEIEKTVCGDPQLSKADEALAQAFAAARAASLDPQALRRGQQDWLTKRNKTTDAAGLAPLYQSRIEELAAQTQQWQHVPRAVTEASLATTCLAVLLDYDDATCAVETAEAVKGDPTLRYQIEAYSDGGLRVGGGVVVFRALADRPGWLAPIAATSAEDAHFGEALLIASPAGRLLMLTGSLDGTGNYDASALFRLDGDTLVSIDTDPWAGEFARRLPKDLAAWKGIYPDYATLSAETPLWQRHDANCCPTGGHASIKLALVNNRVVLRDVTIRRAAAARANADDGADNRVCGHQVAFGLDSQSFADGPASDDAAARETAQTQGPQLIRKAFAELCAKKLLTADEVGKRITLIRISWAGGADDFSAYFPDDAPGTLATEWIWSQRELPSAQDVRDGIICAFRPKQKICADRGP